MDEKQSFDKKLWLIVSIAACAIVIVYSAWPIFQNPQLEPDDYRYLEQVRHLKQDFWGNSSNVLVVENRWDQLWWINIHEKVRFFRPTVVLSYLLDDMVYGSNYPVGLLGTNILIYAACVILVCLINYRWIGPGISFLASSVLFAAFFAHGEVMWYVAGRTDSIAGLFVFGGLTLHIYGKQRPTLRWWAVPCFVLALLTKELTAALPLVLFLSDWWIEERSISFRTLLKREWKIYAAYAVVVVDFFAIRVWIISGPDTGYPYPYFVTFGNPNFSSHLLGQLNSYWANLLFAVSTVPFTIVTDFKSSDALMGLLPGIGAFCLCSVFLYREKKYWILVLLGLACWIPTIMLYQSERYLFIPSFAVAGTAGLLLVRLEQSDRKVYYAALAICTLWIGHQAYSLHVKNQTLCVNPRLAEKIGDQLKLLKSSIPKGSKLLLLNLPGYILQYQFIEDQLRAQLDDPDLEVVVLTPMPELCNMGAKMTIKREGENTITLGDTQSSPIMARELDQFPWVTLNASSVYRAESGIAIEILDGSEDVCYSLRVVLPHPLASYILLKWDPAWEVVPISPTAAVQLTPYGRKLQSTVNILSP